MSGDVGEYDESEGEHMIHKRENLNQLAADRGLRISTKDKSTMNTIDNQEPKIKSLHLRHINTRNDSYGKVRPRCCKP
jgi:hypothetical protein